MYKNKININKTKYRYFLDNANKFLNKTAITYVIPIEKGPTDEDSVDLNRIYKDVKISKRKLIEQINMTADALWMMGIREGDIVTICSSNTPETIYASNTSIEVFLNLDYAQFIAVKDFLHPEAQYSTEHGVKGEEYDNVIFVISKGWNQYQFETYAPMITKKAVIPSGKQASFERNRNLFYVCCSRPKKRLIFFVTVPIDSTFKSFLVELVGEQNIFTFSQYIERKID